MPKPIRNLSQGAAYPGTFTATPAGVLRRLAIRRLVVTGVKAVRGRRR